MDEQNTYSVHVDNTSELKLDIVFIEKLKIPATIGVWEWERRIKQNLIFDLELGCDIRLSADRDNIDDAISYKEVAMRVGEFIADSKFKLLETVAENVAQLLINEFSITWCRVRVSKPRAVEKADNVGIIIERMAKTTSAN